MASETKALSPSSFIKHPDILMSLGVVGIIMLMILPLPRFFLDLLLAFNITVSVIILLVGLQVRRPIEFSAFPSILLIVTLFRLSLNIASTRLILLHGNEGAAAAGEVIRAFGNFVVGGNYTVGLVVFSILVVINFVVVTKGAGRVAEVAARFTLDAMPGKQMSIDADLNAGLINETEARRRRREIAEEADFYGSMDGASKFVRGDAVAAIIIVLVNIIGGLTIGILQQGMSPGLAAQTYTLLTVGEGLVAQIPALFISTAAGIVVTRAAADADLGLQITRQMLLSPKAVGTAAGILLALGVVPGLPHLAFLGLGGVAAWFAYRLSQEAKAPTEAAPVSTAPQAESSHTSTGSARFDGGTGRVRTHRVSGRQTWDRVARSDQGAQETVRRYDGFSPAAHSYSRQPPTAPQRVCRHAQRRGTDEGRRVAIARAGHRSGNRTTGPHSWCGHKGTGVRVACTVGAGGHARASAIGRLYRRGCQFGHRHAFI